MVSAKVKTIWVPDCGEIVWLEFYPPTGREQAPHRPSVVLRIDAVESYRA
nr:type II toxin-antitoxin system PemK/MazF family toxin [Acetobacter persici]